VRSNPFRHRSSACGLPRGWFVLLDTPEQLPAVVETIYPGAIAAWVRRDTFTANTFEQSIARQTGQFRALSELSEAPQAQLIATVCGNCIFHPTWQDGQREPIPCPEPCNDWLSQALRTL
jgi:hypothetical protein